MSFKKYGFILVTELFCTSLHCANFQCIFHLGYNDLYLKKGKQLNNNIEYFHNKNKLGINFGFELSKKINKKFDCFFATDLIYFNNSYNYTSSSDLIELNENGILSTLYSGFNLKIKSKFQTGFGLSTFFPLLYKNSSDSISNQIGLLNSNKYNMRKVNLGFFLRVTFKINDNCKLGYTYATSINPTVELKLNSNNPNYLTKYFLESHTIALYYKI